VSNLEWRVSRKVLTPFITYFNKSLMPILAARSSAYPLSTRMASKAPLKSFSSESRMIYPEDELGIA
jgi:hypothetical protein